MELVRNMRSSIKTLLQSYVVRWTSDHIFSQENALRLLALADSAEYAQRHMKGVQSYPDKKSVLFKALDSAPKTGIFAEFGVWRGTTINAIAEYIGDKTLVHGFDSFEGLPEDWFGDFKKGTFHMKSLPQVRSNVKLYKGWFDSTVPEFVIQNKNQPIAFLHVDCDLYSSTKTIFDNLGDQLKPGSVILFDEYFNYPGWREHEFKAFQELVERQALNYRYIAYNRNEFNVAIQII